MDNPKITIEGKDFNIPPDGSLGLLALGDVGLKAWRQKREEVKAQMEAAKKKEEENKLKDAGNSPINPTETPNE